jgi:hypothetical protein
MTDINPTAAAARENARQTTGQFGAQDHTDPELALMGPYEPGQPVYATVTFEEYLHENDDHPRQVATQKVDIAGVLDTLRLDDADVLRSDPWTDSDFIVYELRKQGALTHPDHPFELDINAGDLDAYLDYRGVHDIADPIAETAKPALDNLAAAAAARKAEIKALQERLAEAQAAQEAAVERILRELGLRADPSAVRLVVMLDHPRYPVELYDADDKWVDIGEEAEHRLVAEIREHLGDDPGVVGGRGTARLVELTATD